MKKKMPLISIVISNYNGAKLNILQECLNSFKKNDYPNYELILVDNASSDNSLEIAKRIFGKDPKFKIIQNPENMYSKGINLAFEKSSGEYIALFNNDISLHRGYLQKLIAAFKKYPKLAIAQGKLLWAVNPSIIDSAGETMDIYGNPVTLGYLKKDDGYFDNDQEILSATGAACLIKKDALKIVGGYDPDYGIGYEDMDHSLRFRRMGFTIMRINDAIAFHKRGVTDLSDMVRVKVRWHFNKNRFSTMIRNYPAILLFKTIPITVLIYLFSMVWEIIVYRNISLAATRIQAIGWVALNLPKIIEDRQEIKNSGKKLDERSFLKFFAKSNILGKVKDVILAKFSLNKILYSLPWTYPSEVKNLIPQGSSILDIGCGDGHLMEWINYKGEYINVVGIDINREDLKVAATRVTVNKKPIYQELFLENLIKNVSFKKKYDIVLCSQVVEHLKKEVALDLIKRIEKLATKRIIVATINGFFQFNHRVPGKYDKHLSGWSPKEFSSMRYTVKGSGLKFIYKPEALKDSAPKFLHPLLFLISYLSTPFLHIFPTPALLLIAYKDMNEKV